MPSRKVILGLLFAAVLAGSSIYYANNHYESGKQKDDEGKISQLEYDYYCPRSNGGLEVGADKGSATGVRLFLREDQRNMFAMASPRQPFSIEDCSNSDFFCTHWQLLEDKTDRITMILPRAPREDVKYQYKDVIAFARTKSRLILSLSSPEETGSVLVDNFQKRAGKIQRITIVAESKRGVTHIIGVNLWDLYDTNSGEVCSLEADKGFFSEYDHKIKPLMIPALQ
jgi:hypothetical protein